MNILSIRYFSTKILKNIALKSFHLQRILKLKTNFFFNLLYRYLDLTEEEKEKLRGSHKVARKLEKLESIGQDRYEFTFKFEFSLSTFITNLHFSPFFCI